MNNKTPIQNNGISGVRYKIIEAKKKLIHKKAFTFE